VAESNEEAPTAKRRRTFSEGEKSLLSRLKQHVKSNAEHSAESSDIKRECIARTDTVSERTKPERKRVVSGEQVTGKKDRKRKRSSIQSVSEQESELGATTAKAVKNGAKKSEVSRKDVDIVHQSDSKDFNQSVKKKKRDSKLKKEKKSKNKHKADPLQLRVISKLVVFLCTMVLVSDEMYFAVMYVVTSKCESVLINVYMNITNGYLFELSNAE